MKIFFEKKGRLWLVFFIILSLLCFSSCNGITPTDHTITATAGTGGSISPAGTIVNLPRFTGQLDKTII